MSTQLLILLQFCFSLLIVVVFLSLMLIKQKQTLARLKTYLAELKSELDGSALQQHISQAIDQTASHSKQPNFEFKPDLSHSDLAIALRYHSLNRELSSLQAADADPNTQWRQLLQAYEALAEDIRSYSDNRAKHNEQLLQEVHREALAEKKAELDSLQQQIRQLTTRLDALAPLQSFINDATTTKDIGRPELELAMHKALVELCENYPNTENLRELVFTIHESYQLHGSSSSSLSSGSSAVQQTAAQETSVTESDDQVAETLAAEAYKSVEDSAPDEFELEEQDVTSSTPEPLSPAAIAEEELLAAEVERELLLDDDEPATDNTQFEADKWPQEEDSGLEDLDQTSGLDDFDIKQLNEK